MKLILTFLCDQSVFYDKLIKALVLAIVFSTPVTIFAPGVQAKNAHAQSDVTAVAKPTTKPTTKPTAKPTPN